MGARRQPDPTKSTKKVYDFATRPPAHVLGWVAVYWDGRGTLDDVRVYTSLRTNWPFGIYEPDPEDLPNKNIQHYLLFHRIGRKMFTIAFNGQDVWYLWGRSDPVYGKLLSGKQWSALCEFVDKEIFAHRGQFKCGIEDWTNGVPE